jgi:hypothetical protein
MGFPIGHHAQAPSVTSNEEAPAPEQTPISVGVPSGVRHTELPQVPEEITGDVAPLGGPPRQHVPDSLVRVVIGIPVTRAAHYFGRSEEGRCALTSSATRQWYADGEFRYFERPHNVKLSAIGGHATSSREVPGRLVGFLSHPHSVSTVPIHRGSRELLQYLPSEFPLRGGLVRAEALDSQYASHWGFPLRRTHLEDPDGNRLEATSVYRPVYLGNDFLGIHEEDSEWQRAHRIERVWSETPLGSIYSPPWDAVVDGPLDDTTAGRDRLLQFSRRSLPPRPDLE